jgi:hypothetical protein
MGYFNRCIRRALVQQRSDGVAPEALSLPTEHRERPAQGIAAAQQVDSL